MTQQALAPQQTLPRQQTQSTRPKVVAAIPCYNEERFIGDIVRQARKHVDQVIVIDDGSQDATSQIAKTAGALVVNHGVNRGYGAAIRSCFEAARTNGTGILVTLDGDNQHTPEEIDALIVPILKGQADLVIGSRYMKSRQVTPNTQSMRQTNMPRYRRLGINIITWLFNIGAKVKVSDAQSGFRAYSRKVVDTISLREKGMGVSVEVLTKARAEGFAIEEVPISCRYHAQSSTLNPFRHGLAVAITVVRLRLENRVQTAFPGASTEMRA